MAMQSLPDFMARVSPPITPALVVRRAAMLNNINALHEDCAARGVRLRAHGKMHKCSMLGRLQIEHGGVGLCCQTVGEAEAFVAGGVMDVLVTSPVPPWGWPRLAALSQRANVAAVVDSVSQLLAARAAMLAGGAAVLAGGASAAAGGDRLTIFVDVDPGMGRAGVAPEHALALAQQIPAMPGLRFGGLQAYCGHHQHLLPAERTAAHANWSVRLKSLVMAFSNAGLPPPQVTGGGTGTAALDLAAGVYTELQAGSYALMDVEYGDLGDLPYQPALFVAASVVSANHAGHVTCDAGHKALHPNGPPQRVLHPAGSRYQPAGDEHGAIIPPGGLREGSLVWLQPGHVDPTVALHDAFFVADEDGTLERWPIDARRVTA
jgi:3-hydroxy-D-aspartate aldolase